MRNFFCSMKKIVLFLTLFLTCVGVSLAVPKKVAVYVDGDMSRTDKTIVNSSVVARISDNKDYRAFERNGMYVNALDKEHDYQVSGEVSLNEIRPLGEQMGVDYVVVVVALISSDNQCHMTARLIDVATGEIVKSVSISREYEGSSTLTNMANNVAYRLLNKRSK